MLLFEAAEKIKKRSFPMSYEGMAKARSPKKEAEEILAQADADIMAIRCIEAQIRLSETLNEFWNETKEEDTFSAQLVYEMLSSARFDAKFDSDGMFDLEATEANESKGINRA